MELIYTDAQWHDLAVVAGCELDCEFGPGSRNSWQLECPADDAPAMSDGSLLYCDGGEVGGVIDGIAPDTGEGTVTFSGRTWHGVLDGNLIAPATGQDYKTVEGEANTIIGSLIAEMGLSDLFAAPSADSGVQVSHQFGRPAATGYQGLVDMLSGSCAKLRMRFDSASRKCMLSAAPKGDYSTEELDGDRLSVKIERDWRPVNHLACFGSGELKDRIRIDLYADKSGNVSKTQSIFGAKHRGAVYDYSSADAETLEKDGRKKLEELQAADEIQVTLPDDSEYEIGDVVGGREAVTGIYTTATITRKTVLMDGDGETDVRYEAGGTASGVSLSNASGGGNGGHAYYAGSGLKLNNYTFSAEVDAAALKAVESKADAAAASASNASAAAGKAEAAAKAATVAADANEKAIAGKQDKLTAGANVTIDGATISAKDTTYGEATATASGLMSAADKKKLDKAIRSGDELMTTNPFTPGATLYISKIDNAFYAADKRFNVSGEVVGADGSIEPLDSYGVARLFNGDYENFYKLKDGDTLVLSMKFDNQPSGTFPGYPYGNILVSAYYDEAPKSIGVRVYNSFEHQGVGWKTLVGSHVGNSKYTNTWSFRNDYYGVEEIEFTFVGSEDNTYRYTGITQIEMHLDRPYSGRNPFLSKYAAEELYYPLTAPKFVGSLQGTADAAKKADKATTASSATSADSATTADRLKTARKVTISGAVNGSAAWDGSGDLSIVVAGDSAAAGFLAAHPVGTYIETNGYDPSDYGGEWQMVPSVGPYTWLRTK